MATLKMPSDGLSNVPQVRSPGWFHFSVVSADEAPIKKATGEQIDKVMITATCQGGTVKGEEKKQYTFWLRNPSESHKDGGEFCAKIQARFADALGILPKDAEGGEEVEVAWAKAGGRQFVAQLTMQKGTDSVERLDMNGCEVYHVDDESVSSIPKNMQVLQLLPAALRRISTDPNNARNHAPAANGNGKTATANKPAGGAAKAAAKTPPVSNDAPADVGGTVDLDNI